MHIYRQSVSKETFPQVIKQYLEIWYYGKSQTHVEWNVECTYKLRYYSSLCTSNRLAHWVFRQQYKHNVQGFVLYGILLKRPTRITSEHWSDLGYPDESLSTVDNRRWYVHGNIFSWRVEGADKHITSMNTTEIHVFGNSKCYTNRWLCCCRSLNNAACLIDRHLQVLALRRAHIKSLMDDGSEVEIIRILFETKVSMHIPYL